VVPFAEHDAQIEPVQLERIELAVRHDQVRLARRHLPITRQTGARVSPNARKRGKNKAAPKAAENGKESSRLRDPRVVTRG
jgi:hypothetical protein